VHAAFSSDNKLLLTAYAFQGAPEHGLDPSALDLWDVATGAYVSLQSIQEGGVGQVAFLPNSTLALCSGRELELWDVQQKKLVQKLEEYGGGLLGVSFDGKLAVCGGPKKDLQVWDLTQWPGTVEK
jgi:WD40 repeat protein